MRSAGAPRARLMHAGERHAPTATPTSERSHKAREQRWLAGLGATKNESDS